MGKPKIYITGWGQTGDGPYFAVAEDGPVLAEHICTNILWAEHDLGATSTWHHDAYEAHYSDGYELVFLADGDKPPDDVVQRNRAMAYEAEEIT